MFKIRKTALEFYDFDYLNKLSAADRLWLMKFCVGYYNASPKNSGLFGTDRHRKACFAANNARNRDMFNKWVRTSMNVVAIGNPEEAGETTDIYDTDNLLTDEGRDE